MDLALKGVTSVCLLFSLIKILPKIVIYTSDIFVQPQKRKILNFRSRYPNDVKQWMKVDETVDRGSQLTIVDRIRAEVAIDRQR